MKRVILGFVVAASVLLLFHGSLSVTPVTGESPPKATEKTFLASAPTEKPSTSPPQPPTTLPPKPTPTSPPKTDPPPPIPMPPPQGTEIDPAKPMLALTFDDGPSKHTGRILDVLECYGARATFFVVGSYVSNRTATVARAYNLGSEILGHTWSHPNLTKLSDDAIRSEIQKTDAAIEKATGTAPTKLYRPPYGAANSRVNSVSGSLGYVTILWSVDTLDWKTRSASAVYSSVMNGASDGAIILCHDLHGTTADAMVQVIPALLAKGYQLVTVTELFYYSGKAVVPGYTYYSGK